MTSNRRAAQPLVGPERREQRNCGLGISNCGFDFAPPGQLHVMRFVFDKRFAETVRASDNFIDHS
jgi:hypothetical protein